MYFDGSFFAIDSAGKEHAGRVDSKYPLTAYYIGGAAVVFTAPDLASITYTTTDGQAFTWVV